ncbi:MAG: hypothetical protein RR623_00300 [Bacilli bacterium]
MELALLVYFASVVEGVSTFLGFFAVGLLFISVAVIFTLLVGNLGVNQYGYDTEDELENELKIKKVLIKSIKWTIPFAVIFALVSVLLPTERTVYLMTAAYATQTIAQNDRVQKIGGDVLEVVEKKLSEMKGESNNDNSK